MPLNIISYKKAIWKGIEGHLKGIVQKLEDSHTILLDVAANWSNFHITIAILFGGEEH